VRRHVERTPSDFQPEDIDDARAAVDPVNAADVARVGRVEDAVADLVVDEIGVGSHGSFVATNN
jgi:hypothetical protein